MSREAEERLVKGEVAVKGEDVDEFNWAFKIPFSAARYSIRASSSWSTVPAVGQDARPIYSSPKPADSRSISKKSYRQRC